MTATLPVVLARLAHELRISAHDSARLETVVQDALSLPDDPVTGAMRAIQGMDLLTQRLADLARFLDVLLAKTPDQLIPLDDALAVIHLQALRRGLSGQTTDADCDAGHVDVF